MKFRATFRQENLPCLLAASAACARLRRLCRPNAAVSKAAGTLSSITASSCYLKLTPTQLFLNVRECMGMEAYSEIDMSDVFNIGWILESKKDNNIALLVDALHLHTTLKLASSCSRITVKLTKRNGQGVLSFEFTDAHIGNLWITQDCPVIPLQGDQVIDAGTPNIPSCEWNVEIPRLKLVVSVLERIRRVGAEEVILEASSLKENDSVCDFTISAVSNIVDMKTKCSNCCLLVPEDIGANPTAPKVSRILTTRRLAAALNATLDVCLGKPKDGLVACVMAENESQCPWICILFHSQLSSLKFFCVIPSEAREEM